MATPIAAFSGISSGLEWRDLIDQIVTLESRPIIRLQSQVALSTVRRTAWSDFESRLRKLSDAAAGLETGDKLRVFRTSLSSAAGSSASPLVSASAGAGATAGTHTVRVLATATAEKLGSLTFTSRSDALGVSGEVRINGVNFEIKADDTLDTIAQRLNARASGSTGTCVAASVLPTGTNQYRLILTSTRTGAAGIDLVDGGTGALRALGFTDGTTSIKNASSSGAQSDGFADGVSSVGSLLGFATPQAGNISIGSLAPIAVDLASMSLDDIASAINDAAGLAGSAITASVIDVTSNGVTGKRLDIRGTTAFTDDNHVLEALGVVKGGRGSIAQVVQGAALSAGGGGPAAGSTALSSLWVGGLAANVQTGDTLSMTGTRGDGSIFSFDYTIAGGDTVQTLLDRLNAGDAYRAAGTSTATASISANGEITVTDDAGGASRLALSIVAHNEGGGRLDLGTFATTSAGIDRRIAAAGDAAVEIDGTVFTRSSNVIADAVPGLTLSLGSASPATPVTVTVDRDLDAVVASFKALVDAYNAVTDFAAAHLAPPPTGGEPQALYGHGSLRSMRSTMRLAMQSVVGVDVAAGLTRLGDIGITIQKDGRFAMDEAKLRTALSTDGDAVTRLLGVHGATNTAALSYTAATDASQAGTYGVNITQAATVGSVLGSGFGGVYSTPGAPDTMTVRDLATGKSYVVALANGSTLANIVDALNAEFAKPQTHVAASGTPVYAVASGTLADEATTFAALHDAGGTGLGVAVGDVITLSGTRPSGGAFNTTFAITDPATQTLGQLRAAVQSALGTDVDVTFANGVLTATAKQPGASQLALTISSDNAGAGSLSFGAFATTTEGRAVSRITAADVGGQLSLTHADYGAASGMEILLAGDVAATASLGLPAGEQRGLDVAGTIGGFAATGKARNLTGSAGSPVEGLGLQYTGSLTGDVGQLVFSRGIASSIRLAAKPILSVSSGSIRLIRDNLDAAEARASGRIAALEARLERRREELTRRYTLMEQAITRAQSQSSWLEAQLAQFRPRKD